MTDDIIEEAQSIMATEMILPSSNSSSANSESSNEHLGGILLATQHRSTAQPYRSSFSPSLHSSSATPPSFLALPREIRGLIYDFVLTSTPSHNEFLAAVPFIRPIQPVWSVESVPRDSQSLNELYLNQMQNPYPQALYPRQTYFQRSRDVEVVTSGHFSPTTHHLRNEEERSGGERIRVEGTNEDFILTERRWPVYGSSNPTLLSLTPETCTRPVNHAIPTALLLSCRQVYGEARLMPWKENEIAFISWHGSGLWAARSFLRREVYGWQRAAMRTVTLDVLVRDLVEDDCGRFGEVVDLLSGDGIRASTSDIGDGDGSAGVRHLRLGIRGRFPGRRRASQGTSSLRDRLSDRLRSDEGEVTVEDGMGRLIAEHALCVHILRRMRNLRCLWISLEGCENLNLQERLRAFVQRVINIGREDGEQVTVVYQEACS